MPISVQLVIKENCCSGAVHDFKMPKDTEEVPPPAFPHLPEELWLHIASLLSTEEWARASETCKALQKLQVERASIKSKPFWKDPAATSALLWVASHLHGAKSVVVDGWPVRSAVSKEDFKAIRYAMQPALEASLCGV